MTRNKFRRLLACLLCLILITSLVPAMGETLQDCHRVKLEKHDTKQSNGSIIRIWTATTALPAVDAELAAISQKFADEIGPTLPQAANKTSRNSRVDVETRYSRTGLKWMSFVIQARTTYHRQLVGQVLETRTYDMTTGEQYELEDLFPEDSDVWSFLASEVRSQVLAYFPDEEAPGNLVDEMCTEEALRKADYSLHGFSLVLHYPASYLYPQHQTLMEVTIMYDRIRPYMTEEAQAQTDNLSYYKTCALTFDDGPSRDNTTNVMQNLMIAGCRATFFVIGNRISKYTDQMQREHDEGHAIGSHNWHHGNVTKSSAASLRAMKGKCDNAFIAAIGIPPRYNRVPYGLYPKMNSAKVGWANIQWSVDTYDWRGISSTNVLNKVKKQIADGDIILCHDIKDNTPTSAARICEYLTENGYMLLTIDELFAKDGVTLEPDTVYFRCTNGDTSIKK